MPLSYEFHLIPLSSIKVPRRRQRKKLRQIDDLANSIDRNGLFHPIIVTRKRVLVAGERRFTAFKKLGKKEIPVHYLDELSSYEARAIELEENIKRLDLSWQENSIATEEYHELRVRDDSEWTKKATAEAIGLGPQQIGKLIQVAKALKAKNKQVLNAGGFEAAYRVIKRAQSRVVQTEVAQIDFISKTKGKKEKPNEEREVGEVFAADFIEWCKTYNGRRFNSIHCDFPYGISYEKTNYSGSESWEKYDDSPELYQELLQTLVQNKDKLFFHSAHLMFWFSMKFYEETKKTLEAAGFAVNPFPLIWVKDRGIIPDPLRGPRRVTETAFFCSLGDRKVIKSVPNAAYHKVEKTDHISTKPRAMLLKFFEMFVDTSTEILDPTCGSGSALVAAQSLGAKRIVGLDTNEEYVDATQRGLKLARKRDEKA